eukprot:6040581-Lingulodinium_polyedra.AAC.1
MSIAWWAAAEVCRAPWPRRLAAALRAVQTAGSVKDGERCGSAWLLCNVLVGPDRAVAGPGPAKGRRGRWGRVGGRQQR